MIIEHTDKRRVEGATYCEPPMDFWWKEVDGVIMSYYRKNGWREVQEVKRIDVTGACRIDEYGYIYHNGRSAHGKPYTRSIVTRHDLPEDILGVFKQFECQVIVIERDQ